MSSAAARAIDILGGPVAAAAALSDLSEKFGERRNLTYQAVQGWIRTRVPDRWCRLVEHAVDGQVSVHDLRPDVFGPPSREVA